MKILVAIQSSENPELLCQNTLSWACRSGFELRVFIPNKEQLSEYTSAADNMNYDHFVAFQPEQIIINKKPLKYAVTRGFDLLLMLPEDLPYWMGEEDPDRTIIQFAADIAAARFEFSKDETIKERAFNNGAVLYRVWEPAINKMPSKVKL